MPKSSKLHLTSPQQKKGSQFETLACQYLQQQGLTLLAKNWLQPKVGELDLVMIEAPKTPRYRSYQTSSNSWDTLVFVEVRARVHKNNQDIDNIAHRIDDKVSISSINQSKYKANYGDAITSITKAKQRKLIKTARYFLQQHPEYTECECRFDIVAFDIPAELISQLLQHDLATTGLSESEIVTWIQGAFMAQAW